VKRGRSPLGLATPVPSAARDYSEVGLPLMEGFGKGLLQGHLFEQGMKLL
jgi:hypothetical protein